MLDALGDGGTVEMAERAVAHAEAYRLDESRVGGLSEVCAELGVSRQQVGHWMSGRRPAPAWFPWPTWQVSSGPLWEMSQVREVVKLSARTETTS